MFLTNLLCSKFLSLIWISSLLWLYFTTPEFIIWWTCLCGCNTWFGDYYLILCLFLTKFLLQQELKLISYLSRSFIVLVCFEFLNKSVRMWSFAVNICIISNNFHSSKILNLWLNKSLNWMFDYLSCLLWFVYWMLALLFNVNLMLICVLFCSGIF